MKTGSAELSAGVISTVDGEPITRAQLEALSNRIALPRQALLRRLQDRILLGREAEARGLDGGRPGRRATRRAMVQSLLAEAIEAVPVPEDMLRKAYEAQRDRFVHGSKRACVHVVAQVARDASPSQRAQAKRLATRARALLADAPALASEAGIERLKRQVADWQATVPVEVEAIPPVARDGRLVDAFSAALFSVDQPGVLDAIVETDFGFHAVAVTEVLEAVDRPYPQVRAELAQQQQQRHREQRLEALVQQLMRDRPIERHPAVLELLAGAQP